MIKHLKSPHALRIESILEQLNTCKSGLSNEEVKKRQVIYGLNELAPGKSESPLLLFIKQFKSWLVIILIIAAIISWLAKQNIDTVIIIMVVFINAGIGFFQEYRAEKAISALHKMIVKTAKVLRDKQLLTVLVAELVPGDIVILEEGDGIPADGRIIESKNMRTTESSLTGESLPVSKIEMMLAIDTHLADRKNMVWKGTFVAGGYAKMVVTGTGINTALGNISESIKEIKTKRSNFTQKTDILAKQMSIIAVASAIFIFLVGYFYRDFEIKEILLIAIAALVAAVPEGLPAVISIILAIGAHRMAKRNAIIREFSATETLGAVTTILTDKTGTLTQNSLTVRKAYVFSEDEYTISGEGLFPAGHFTQNDSIIGIENHKSLQKLLKIAALSNNSQIRHLAESNTYELMGDPTEGALSVLARKGGIESEDFKQNKLDDLPFDSSKKLRASLIKENKHQELYVTGAPEKLLDLSPFLLTDKGEVTLSQGEKQKITDKISEWSNQAMRVIALCYTKQDHSKINENDINDLVFVGIVGMIDPPRPSSRKAVEKCKQAGIRVIMVTGDHINTAIAIAKASGIIEDEENNVVKALNEQQLERLGEKEFDDAIETISIFARLSPKMKLRIAQRLQAKGQLIAMTGDGVNDAPVLKKADVGISMGIMGTEVARESSDVVLADDNFATIVAAIEEGRIVFRNSRQASFFLITTNIAESVTLLACISLELPLPLTATQLLWLNLVTDGITTMALATEPGHGEIFKSFSFFKNENILSKEVIPFLLINVSLMAVLSIATFYYYIDQTLAQARTGVFIIMAFTQLFNVFNMRSIQKSAFGIGFFSNKYINLAVGVSVVLTVLVTELDYVARIFHFEALNIVDVLLLLVLSSLVLWFGELYKHFKSTT